MRTSEATDKIIPEWVRALHEVNAVTKDSSGHHGKYATLGACLDAVKPVLAAHGLALHQYNASYNGVRIVTRIWHESGQWIEDEGLDMPAPNDPQKVGGSVTYARRYALTTFFGITTTDDDANDATAYMRNPPQERPQAAVANDQPSEAALQVFGLLKRYKGTQVAEAMKQYAADEHPQLPQPFTLASLNADSEWCNAVALKLAEVIEAES